MMIFIAGPYTNGDVAMNVRRAMDAADALLEKGHMPFIPHLFHFWHIVSPKPYETWIELDKKYLRRCDALLRLDGYSEGADGEVALAKLLEIPVYYSVDEL